MTTAKDYLLELNYCNKKNTAPLQHLYSRFTAGKNYITIELQQIQQIFFLLNVGMYYYYIFGGIMQ